MSEPSRELGLRDYVSVVRRRWRWVVLTPVVVLLLIGGLTLGQQRVYETTAEVLILTDANEALFPTSAITTERLRRNPFAEQQYLSSEVFRESVGADVTGLPSVSYELGRTDPDQDLADAGILVFRARADSAAGAAAVANDHAEGYVVARHRQDVAHTNEQLESLRATFVRLQEQRAASDAQLASLRTQLQNAPSEAAQEQLQADIALLEEERNLLDLAGQVRETTAEIAELERVSTELADIDAAARVHNPALVPSSPESPDVPRNLMLAAIAGLVLGVAAAIARDLLDRTARDPSALAEATGAPVLGAVGVNSEGLVHDNGYQTVLNSLSLSSTSPTLRTIAVTSATESVGKTETVINLARIESSAGARVLVIDGDPISPRVIARLGPTTTREIDIDDALAVQKAAAPSSSDDRGGPSRYPSWALSRAAPDEPPRQGVSRIDVIELFTSDAASGDLVRNARVENLIDKLEARYDLILIDTHAVLSPIDVRPLLTKADAVIVVYEPDESRVDDLTRTIELLRGANVQVAGLVANRASASAPGYRYSRLPDTDDR